MRYIYTMEYFSTLKENTITSFVGKWVELETIMLSEISQLQKNKFHMFSLMCGVQIKKRHESRRGIDCGGGVGRTSRRAEGHQKRVMG
jgi:hypothetical protein